MKRRRQRKTRETQVDWEQLTFDFQAIGQAAADPSHCPLPKRVLVHTIRRGLLAAHIVRHAAEGFHQIMLARTFQRADGTSFQTPAISDHDVRLAQSLLAEAKDWIARNAGKAKRAPSDARATED